MASLKAWPCLLCLLYCSQYNSSSSCLLWQTNISFFWKPKQFLTLCLCVCTCVCSRVCVCLSHLLAYPLVNTAAVRNASINAGVQGSPWNTDFICYAYEASCGIPSTMGDLVLSFWENSVLAFIVAVLTCFLTNSVATSPLFQSLPRLVIIYLFVCFFLFPTPREGVVR